MTPMEAIQSATRNAAQALGREADVGAIAVGRYGDIVAVAGDPLADVRALEHVDVVIKGGAVVSDRRATDPEDASVCPFPRLRATGARMEETETRPSIAGGGRCCSSARC